MKKTMFLLAMFVMISATVFGQGVTIPSPQTFTNKNVKFTAAPTYSSGGYKIAVLNTATNRLEQVVAGTVSSTNFAKIDSNGAGGAVTYTYLKTTVPFSIYSGAGDPNGTVSAPIGSIYSRTNGVLDSVIYSKVTGSGDTGWYPLKNTH